MKNYYESSYHYDDGTNISSALKEGKVKLGWIKFFKIKERFGIESWENKNNIIVFKINSVEYNFGLVSQKIRKTGHNKWTGKVIDLLNKNK